MFLYIKFYINNKQNHNKFLFWSCVLDTICTKVDYDYLNRDNEYNLPDSKNLSIIQEFSKFSFDELDSDDSYKKRNPVFRKNPV